PGGRGYESSPRFISVFSRPTICCCPAAAASSLSHIPVNPRRISASPSSTCDRRSVGYSRIALSTRVFCSRNPRISALISVTSRSAASQHSGGCRVLLAAAHSLLQFAYPCLQRRDAAFHVGWLSHDGGIPAVPPAPQSYGLTRISQFCSKVKGVEP